MNKKGYSLSGWTEAILIVIGLTVVISAVIGDFNILYDKDNQLGIGGNSTQNAFIDYQQSASDEITGGEVELTNEGFSLKSGWGVLRSLGNILWSFFTGGFVETLCNYARLPTVVGITLRILWFISVVLSFLYIVFKVKA